MATCMGITQAGGRCKGIAIDGSGYCYAHHPDYAQERKRAARKGGHRGGRGRRPQVELQDIKRRLSELADRVLEGEVDRADAAVAGQLINYLIRAVSVELKAREQEELTERLEALEEALQQKGDNRWGA